MDNRVDPRYIFMALGGCLALFSPLFLIIVPLAVVDTLYYRRDIWITYVPGENYVAFGVGLLFLVLACALLWLFKVKKWTITVAGGFVILSGLMFYFASLSFVTLSEEKISYRTLFSQDKQIYAWEELDQLLYFEKYPEDDEVSYYEFYFKNGQMLTMKQNSFVTDIQGSLTFKVRTLKIPIEYVRD